GSEFSFILGAYDPTRPLILDPAVLVYCGYVGGVGDDLAFDLAVDALGRAYVVGTTTSGEDSFPVEVGPDLTLNGQDGHWDAFVARVNAAGTALEYCGYIGGAGDDIGVGIALDAEDNAYVTGSTGSTEASFPVLVGPDLTFNGEVDVFVARVNAAGTALDYCGYIGGADSDRMSAIAVDGAGRAYVTGGTRSDEASFPVTVGPDLTFNSAAAYVSDAFVARVNAAGTALDYCGYIGGGANESDAVIAVDGLGRAYVAGTTESTESSFPVVGGPDLAFSGGERDGFVARVDAAGTALEYCGYLGGSGLDSAWGLAVDGEGRAYVTGYTESSEDTFPVQVGPDLTHNGAGDAFVARVRADGLGLDYCGYIGGAGDDATYDVAADVAGNAYVTGWTASGEATLPVRDGPDLTFNGGADAWIARVSAAGTALDYCGYIGGSGVDWGEAIAVDGAGQAYVAGITYSGEATFPARVGPDLTYNGGLRDTFVARVRWFGDSIPFYLPQVFHAFH
ncbi:MAG: SBBP repeat-containing protein, partial [Anaerolineae bacterium]